MPNSKMETEQPQQIEQSNSSLIQADLVKIPYKKLSIILLLYGAFTGILMGLVFGLFGSAILSASGIEEVSFIGVFISSLIFTPIISAVGTLISGIIFVWLFNLSLKIVKGLPLVFNQMD